MIRIHPVNNPEFRAGDKVVLAEGPYEGTPGVFVTLRKDPNWADIKERNNIVRCHPVIWLEQSRQLAKSVQGQVASTAVVADTVA